LKTSPFIRGSHDRGQLLPKSTCFLQMQQQITAVHLSPPSNLLHPPSLLHAVTHPILCPFQSHFFWSLTPFRFKTIQSWLPNLSDHSPHTSYRWIRHHPNPVQHLPKYLQWIFSWHHQSKETEAEIFRHQPRVKPTTARSTEAPSVNGL